MQATMISTRSDRYHFFPGEDEVVLPRGTALLLALGNDGSWLTQHGAAVVDDSGACSSSLAVTAPSQYPNGMLTSTKSASTTDTIAGCEHCGLSTMLAIADRTILGSQ